MTGIIDTPVTEPLAKRRVRLAYERYGLPTDNLSENKALLIWDIVSTSLQLYLIDIYIYERFKHLHRKYINEYGHTEEEDAQLDQLNEIVSQLTAIEGTKLAQSIECVLVSGFIP